MTGAKIDSHQHFWRYSVEDYGWIGPEMAMLKKNHLPTDLAPLLEAQNISGTVAVQARQLLEETEWLLSLADQHSFIKGVVGWVDLRSPDAEDQLARFTEHPRLCGIRHVVQDEPDNQFMLRDEFQRGIATLAEFDLAYDILIFPRQLPAACELVARFPDHRFVLDHIAKPFIKDGRISPWDEDVRQLAAFPNVACKVSGMITEADWHDWQPSDFTQYLDVIFEAFGPQRIMFGSDWPVCTVAGTYQEVAQIVTNYVQNLSITEQIDVWGNTARKFYKLEME